MEYVPTWRIAEAQRGEYAVELQSACGNWQELEKHQTLESANKSLDSLLTALRQKVPLPQRRVFREERE